MLNSAITFSLTQLCRDDFTVAEKELALFCANNYISVELSTLHSRRLELHMGGGRYIGPNTNLFGHYNSFGINQSELQEFTMELNLEKLSIYGINAELILNIGYAVGTGTLIGAGVLLAMSNPITGSIALVLAPMMILATWIMKYKQDKEMASYLARAGMDLTQTLAYSTNLLAIREFIDYGLINTIDKAEFEQAVDVDAIQNSFAQNIGNRSWQEYLNSVEKYLDYMTELDRLISSKLAVNDAGIQFEKELAKIINKDLENIFLKIGYDKTAAAGLNDIVRRTGTLFSSPRSFKITDGSVVAGKTYFLPDFGKGDGSKLYLNVEVPSDDVAFLGQLADSVTDYELLRENYSFYCNQSENFKQELQGIPVEGQLKIAGYTGVSVIKPLLKEAYNLGICKRAFCTNVSVEINQESDCYSEFVTDDGVKVVVPNVIRSTNDQLRISASRDAKYDVETIYSRNSKDYAVHFDVDLVHLLIINDLMPLKVLECLDDVTHLSLGRMRRFKQDDAYYVEFYLSIQDLESIRYIDNPINMSLKEATFLNSSLNRDLGQFKILNDDQAVEKHFGFTRQKIDIKKLIITRKIRVYAKYQMGQLTSSSCEFFDANVELIRFNEYKFYIFDPLSVEGTFSGADRCGPQFQTDFIKGGIRAWKLLE